jgi:hypothetical protein
MFNSDIDYIEKCKTCRLKPDRKADLNIMICRNCQIMVNVQEIVKEVFEPVARKIANMVTELEKRL